MRPQVSLGSLFGIRIGLHASWFLIAALVTTSLAGHFTAVYPTWTSATVWTSALLTAFLFFSGLVLHELSHALVALSRGLPVSSITLFALGGVATMEKESEEPSTEFWMAVAGPVMSLVLGAAGLTSALLLGWTPLADPGTPATAVLAWLGVINVGLGLFNLVPGFPMDGGRILRAALWWITGDGVRATRMAARVGQAVALSFVAAGLVRFALGAGLPGLWMSFVGWFLMAAATATHDGARTQDRLRGVRVADVMSRECAVVDGRSSLRQFLEDHVMPTGARCFAVVEDGLVAGLVTPMHVAAVAPDAWDRTPVHEVMSPMAGIHAVAPETSLTETLETMTRDDVAQLPVVAEGRLLGIVFRRQVLALLQGR